jgi:hypothetical protein
MRQTLFLGIAAVLDAIGAFLASNHHLYTAYGCFTGAIAMVCLAIWFSYRDDYRLKRGKKELGEVLVELSQAEVAAHKGLGNADYDKLIARIDAIEIRVAVAAGYLGDSSIESRFRAVNVHDIELSVGMKRHFIDRGQGSFWTMYQKIKAQRLCIERLLGELRRG